MSFSFKKRENEVEVKIFAFLYLFYKCCNKNANSYYSDRFYDSSVKFNSRRYLKAYFTFLQKTTYKEKLKLHTYFEVSKEYFID